MKYGALSSPTGTLDLTSAADDGKVILTWLERGGPDVTAPDAVEGFGSKLIRRSVAGQLGGSIDYEWSAEGVIITLKMSRDRLTT